VVGVLAALGFVVAAGWQTYDIRTLSSRGVLTTAAVVGESHGRDPRITVRFTTAAGEVVQADTANYKEPADPGDTIEIVYDPQDPHRLQAADWGYDYWLPAICLGGGVLVGAYTYGVWRGWLPRRRR
jgi:hypothetical protein